MDQTPEELAQKIKDAQARQGLQQPESPGEKFSKKDNSAAGQALRAGVDLAAALFVGGFIGYWADRWLGTKPLFMILMFFLGFGAGFLNIWRTQMGQDYKTGFRKDKKEEPGKEERVDRP